jgi:hypothetical protein
MENSIQRARTGKLILGLFAVSLLASVLGACAAGVGDPCVPEKIPSSVDNVNGENVTVYGFVKGESYIEAGSVQCQTRVCGVFNLVGDPSGKCQNATSQGGKCPDQATIDQHVYCTCRCAAPSKDFATCTCPSGFECVEALSQGEIGVRGSYCVKSGTFASTAR